MPDSYNQLASYDSHLYKHCRNNCLIPSALFIALNNAAKHLPTTVTLTSEHQAILALGARITNSAPLRAGHRDKCTLLCSHRATIVQRGDELLMKRTDDDVRFPCNDLVLSIVLRSNTSHTELRMSEGALPMECKGL